MQSIIIEFLASFLIWLMFLGLFVVWYLDGKVKKEMVLHGFVAFWTAWIIAEILKKLIPTARPFMVNGGEPLTLTISSDGSFPSGHSAAAFALATTIWLHDRKVGWAYIIAALIVGTARVLANVHYPVDILAGAILGILTAFSVEKLHLFKLIWRNKHDS